MIVQPRGSELRQIRLRLAAYVAVVVASATICSGSGQAEQKSHLWLDCMDSPEMWPIRKDPTDLKTGLSETKDSVTIKLIFLRNRDSS